MIPDSANHEKVVIGTGEEYTGVPMGKVEYNGSVEIKNVGDWMITDYDKDYDKDKGKNKARIYTELGGADSGADWDLLRDFGQADERRFIYCGGQKAGTGQCGRSTYRFSLVQKGG